MSDSDLPGEPVPELLYCIECAGFTPQRKSVAGDVTGFLCLRCESVETWRKQDGNWIINHRASKQ